MKLDQMIEEGVRVRAKWVETEYRYYLQIKRKWLFIPYWSTVSACWQSEHTSFEAAFKALDREYQRRIAQIRHRERNPFTY